jgi:L,D-peptidoglycan transpeptidase YkuD (ErfK/YbiS/YcfS/YnhG family)
MFKNVIKTLSVYFLISSVFFQKLPVSAGTLENKELNFSGLEKQYASKQAIVVFTNKESDYKAKIDTYQNIDGEWKRVFPQMDAMIGMNGITENKVEGDKKSPAGIFRISEAFGTAVKPSNLKLPYTRTGKNHYWIDDALSTDYNSMVYYDGDPYRRWNSFERLTLKCYKYVLVINYNMNPVVKNKGSAIFLHKYSSQKNGSFGCTEVSEGNLVKLLNWIDAGKNPVIIQGTAQMISEALNSIDREIKVNLNGKELSFDVRPVITGGRTLVPARAIFEALGLTLEWDEKTGTVTGKNEAKTIVLMAGHDKAIIDGNISNLDVPARIIDNRMMVPVRFISECFGAQVGWNQENSTVIIKI